MLRDIGGLTLIVQQNGALVLDMNGKLYPMRTVVNDGKYYVLNIERNGRDILVNLMGDKNEMFRMPSIGNIPARVFRQ